MARREAPTTIEYSGGKLKFHGIVSENHESSSQVTSYPVQTGFQISNHAIRKNRVIKIEGLYTNTLSDQDTGQQRVTTSDISKYMYGVLDVLVRNSEVCKVGTNLGVYDPVVFTSFKVKQDAGNLDNLRFVMMGEEVQVASAVERLTPIELSFTILTGGNRGKAIDKLKNSNLKVPKNAVVKQAEVTLGRNFKTTYLGTDGLAKDVTYLCDGYDKGKDEYAYSILVEPTSVATKESGVVNPPASIDGLWKASTASMGGSSHLGEVTDNIKEDENSYFYTAKGNMRLVNKLYLQETTVLGQGTQSKPLKGFGLDYVSCEKEVVTSITDVDPLKGKELSLEDKLLEDSVLTVNGMGSELTNKRKGLPPFPENNYTVTIVESNKLGALTKLGDTVR